MSTILVVAPHPDDETLGCGGTIMRHRAEGDDVHWVIGTAMHASVGFTGDRIAEREEELARVARHYGFASTSKLGFTTTRLDTVPRADLVSAVADVVSRTSPDAVYVPFHGDAHSDHRGLAEATLAACKWFRAPSVNSVYAYETLSETNFASFETFHPNVFTDISRFLDAKLAAMALYRSEVAKPPFPRSLEAIRALALLRGSEAGFVAAEAFMLMRQRRE